MTDRYESPLASRYASDYMLELFSADMRYRTWRKLWVSLARAEMRLGLPVTEEQVADLERHVEDIDYECVRLREKEVRHDVMAHVYAYGKAALCVNHYYIKPRLLLRYSVIPDQSSYTLSTLHSMILPSLARIS